MLLSVFALALLVFLLGACWLGWFAVTGTALGVVALIATFLLVVEGSIMLYRKFMR